MQFRSSRRRGAPENSLRLLEFLAGEEAQQWYSEVNSEYPVRSGVPVSETLAAWGPVRGR